MRRSTPTWLSTSSGGQPGREKRKLQAKGYLVRGQQNHSRPPLELSGYPDRDFVPHTA